MNREEIMAGLREIIQPDKLEAWLDSPNSAFGGWAPRVLLDHGDFAGLERMIVQIRSGVAS